MKNTAKFVLPLFMLGACASVETKLPVPDRAMIVAEADMQTKQAFERRLAQYERLNRIGTKILAKNADLCNKTRLDFGIYTHTLKSYPKKIRPYAARFLGASETPKVISVRENSPAEAAGIKRGDILLDNKNRPTGIDKISLQAAKSLRIRRGDEVKTVSVAGRKVCDTKLILKNSAAVNAYANGKDIIISSAMMDFAASDDELALVIGHELAHNTMGHVKKAIWNSVISGFAWRTTRPFEAEADYVGLYYSARAGYKIDGVEKLWRRLGVLFPKSIVSAKSHPITPKRLLALKMTAKEINNKKKAGLPLVPNLKNPQNTF